MSDGILDVIEQWQSDERLAELDEARIKSAVIEPILRGLGWNTKDPDELWPEYPVNDEEKERVDYALLIGKTPKVFVEVKRGGEPLERHQRQFMGYAFHGVQIAALTNGATWWFYLPIREVSWERRKVATVELDRQNSNQIARTLDNLLSKENVKSGEAIQNAERHQVLEALPDVWNRLVSEPGSPIVNLLAERTHRLCVREPDRDEVEQFLSGHLEQIQITPLLTTPAPVTPLEPDPSPEPSSSGSVTGKKPVAFAFNGSRYEVKSWRGMLIRLCDIVYSAHRNHFEEVLNLRGKSRPPFSRNDNDLVYPAQINGRDFFVETHGTANMVVRRAEDLIAYFGYNKNNLSYELHR